jgi:uncharacterized protein (TIGR03437 family)
MVTSKPEVLIDGRPSDYYFAGLTPCCIGTYQINALVGSETASGTVKVVVIQDGVASNEGTLLVQ